MAATRFARSGRREVLKRLIRRGWGPAGLAVALLALLLGGPGAAAQQPPGDMTFPQTGMTLTDAHGFLTYWQSARRAGPVRLPADAESAEVSPTDGRSLSDPVVRAQPLRVSPRESPARPTRAARPAGPRTDRGRAAARRLQPRRRPAHAAAAATSRRPATALQPLPRLLGAARRPGPLRLPDQRGVPGSATPPTARPTPCSISSATASSTTPRTRARPIEVLLGLLGVQMGGFPLPRRAAQPTPRRRSRCPERFWAMPQVADAPHPDRSGGHADQPVRRRRRACA